MLVPSIAKAVDTQSENGLRILINHFTNEKDNYIVLAMILQRKIDQHFYVTHLIREHGVSRSTVQDYLLTPSEMKEANAKVTEWVKQSSEARDQATQLKKRYMKKFNDSNGNTRTPDKYNSSPRRFE
jgi:hypothetical protein